MKKLTLIVLLLGFLVHLNAQQLNLSEVSGWVNLVDQQIKLNDYQKKELNSIFSVSATEINRVQRLNKGDVEKLQLLSVNQKNTREKLEVVLDYQQHQAYKALLDGGKTLNTVQPVIQQPVSEETLIGDAHDAAIPDIYANSNTPNNNNSNTATLNLASAHSIADKLNFKGNEKLEFIKAYNTQEKTINDIQANGTLDVTAGINLLTSILLTDFKIIDLGGKSTYENYFQMRSSGQLGLPASSNGKDVDINQVYQLHDLTSSLELSDDQNEEFIRLILDGEANKKTIRQQYQGAERSKRLKALEQNSLKKLQQILSTSQIQKLMQIMGK